MSEVSSNNPDGTLSPDSRREGDATPTARSTQVGNIDLSERKDRGLVREASRQRWPISGEFKAKAAQALERAMDVAAESGDTGQIVDCVRTLAVIEKQNQDDEHLAEKNGRIDLGKATERVEGSVQAIVMRVVGPRT